MDIKLIRYEFWEKVLKSPQFVAAPMVDMSELSFRMLCRNYGAQLCFSPMLHSQQYTQDTLYRSDTFSTCSEDKPLIVQFCSNNPNDFISAAKLVSSQCNAIDLNLGCPQAIAKKGHYGSFLQDDWDLIHSIVRKASNDLPVPVTCKMRILPGDFRKSIQYAKMLEDSGCSVLTVHGRTRDQKGHATGLASWNIIREIKANVNIPVIANGNILSFSDIEECLTYTGADAVMSAEALLQNPALFSGKNPPVWDIVQEYLQYAEKYNTPIRCVRCHLFKILYLCIHQDSKIQKILADGKTYADFFAVCDLLQKLPKIKATVSQKDKIKDNHNFTTEYNIIECSDNDEDDLKLETNFDFVFQGRPKFYSIFSDESLVNEQDSIEINPTVNSRVLNVSDNGYFNNETKNNSGFQNLKLEIDLKDSNVLDTKYDYESSFIQEKHNIKHFPIWLCHSRPRVVNNETVTRGCYSKYFESSDQKLHSAEKEQFMSKKKLRKLRHHEKVIAAKKEKRKMKKMRRKQKLMELRQMRTEEKEKIMEVLENTTKLTKKEKKNLIRERLKMAQGSAPKICINLGFTSEMNMKELTRLSSQLRRLYGSNRHSISPLHLYFCNLHIGDTLYNICVKKNDGFSSYVVDMTEKSPEEIFALEDLVYLSPDAENVLTSLDHCKVYVIGGIVDGTVRKGLSFSHAKQFNIQTARLPIVEYLMKCSEKVGTTVLTVNQVFDILLKYYETGEWLQALGANVPFRKGYYVPSQKKPPEETLKITVGASS